MEKDKEWGGGGQGRGLRDARGRSTKCVTSQPLAVLSAADHKPGDLCTKRSSVPIC